MKTFTAITLFFLMVASIGSSLELIYSRPFDFHQIALLGTFSFASAFLFFFAAYVFQTDNRKF